MIEEFIAALTAGAIVGALSWRQRRLKRLQEQLEFVQQFAEARQSVRHDPEINKNIKDFLEFAAQVIDDTQVARLLFSSQGPKAEARRSPILVEILALPEAQRTKVFTAMRCFLMALSYQVRSEGYKFRATLAGSKGDKAVKVDVAKMAGLQINFNLHPCPS